MTTVIGRYDYDGIRFTLFQLEPNDVVDAAPGDRMFVMQGRVVVADFAVTAPRLIIFGTPRQVEAIDALVYLFRWKHPDAPDNPTGRHDTT